MAANDRLIDGALDFLGGQDASKIPDRVAENAYYAGVNTSTERGALRPRWPVVKQRLNFKEEYYTLKNQYKRSYEDIFYSGKFQAIAPYVIGGVYHLVLVVSGIIYLVNTKTLYISVLHISDGSFINQMSSRVNWTSAEKYLILFDYPAYPVIIENGVARRSDPTKLEIPVSNLGVYNQNRLVIANIANEFTAGDPYGSLDPTQIGAPITFAEIMTSGSAYYGQVFKLPTFVDNDPITAMGFLQMTDSSTGIGVLLAATKSAVYSYATNQPRSNWEAGQFGSNMLFNSGIVGPRAMCNVNSDLFFVSADGQLRTLSMSRDEQRKWTKEPISREVQNWLKYFDLDLARFSVLAYYHNKILLTANPYRTKALTRDMLPVCDYAFGGFVVLETDNIATLGSTSPPTWAGLWTGIRPMDVVVSNEDCYIMAKDDDVRNELYLVDRLGSVDRDGSAIRYIRSKVYTREHDFKDPFANKAVHSIALNFDNLQGDFSLDVKYKPSHAPYFINWNTYQQKVPWRSCCPPKGSQLMGFEGQHIRDLNLGSPNTEACNSMQEYYHAFRKIQLQLTIEGKYWELHEYRIQAVELPLLQNITDPVCKENQAVDNPVVCNDDWAITDFETCEEAES